MQKKLVAIEENLTYYSIKYKTWVYIMSKTFLYAFVN